MNIVILQGNLTRDPELRVTPNGNTIGKFGLAVNEHYTTRDGERRERTVFVDVDVFGKRAEVISKYFKKGSPLLMNGKLKFDQWEDGDQKRQKLGVILDSFEFVGPKPENASKGGKHSPRSGDGGDTLDEDIPF